MKHYSYKLAGVIGLATLLGGCPKGVGDLEGQGADQTTPVAETSAANTTEPAPFTPDPTPAPAPAATPAFDGGDSMDDGVAAAASGDLNGARSRFQDLLDDPEVGGYAAYNLGVIAYREGEVRDAERFFEDALEKQSDLGPPLVALIRMRLRDGDRAGARNLLNAQLSASDNAPQIEAAGLYITLAEGNYERVITEGRALLLEDAGNLDVFFTMAVAYLETGRPSLAEYIVDQGIGRDNTRAEFQVLRARIMMDNENMTGAQSVLENVLARDPYHAEALNNLGVIQMRSRNYVRAESSFDGAISYAPEYAEAWLNLGNARKGQQNYAGAQEAFNQALQVSPNYAAPYYNLAVLYLDAEMDGFTRVERLEQSLSYFDAYASAVGTIPSTDLYHTYRAEAQSLLDTEMSFQNDSSGGDDWGDGADDGSAGGGDDWGDGADDGGGDDWGDDGGGDDWGDDGGGDDWGDDGGGDDWGDDDWGDDEW